MSQEYRKPSHKGNGTGVWVSTEYLKLTRSANAALLLAQIVHWSRITSNPNGWFYKTYEQWHQELNLSKFEIMNAIGKPKKNSDQPMTPGTIETGFTLTELGVETKVFRNNNMPKVHYRVNMIILDQYWSLARAYISQSEARDSQETSLSDSQETSLSYKSQETSLSYKSQETSLLLYTEIPTKSKQTEGSKDVCLPLSNDDKEIPSALEEKEEGIGATVIDMNTDIYAPALRALATEFGHFATYDDQRLLARHIDERGLPAVLDAIRACKQNNPHPHSPAKYVIGYLNNTPHITSEMTEHIKAYSSPKTNNIPDYKPTQSEYADLKEIAKCASPNDLARFIKHLKEEAFWQGKIVTTTYIRKNLSAWKAQQ